MIGTLFLHRNIFSLNIKIRSKTPVYNQVERLLNDLYGMWSFMKITLSQCLMLQHQVDFWSCFGTTSSNKYYNTKFAKELNTQQNMIAVSNSTQLNISITLVKLPTFLLCLDKIRVGIQDLWKRYRKTRIGDQH